MCDSKLICCRNFLFQDDETNESLSLVIKDLIDEEFGSYTWPSAVVLAQYLWQNRKNFCGKSFLELGCGTALPSLIALKCLQPKAVILTDKICTSRLVFYLCNLHYD